MKILKESNKYRDFEWTDELYAVIKNDGTYAGAPCRSYAEAVQLSYHVGSKIFKLVLDDSDKEWPMAEGISDRIRKNDLEGGDGSYWASEGDVDIDIQDREKHTHEFGTTINRWGKKFIGDPLNKHPRVATSTWGRVWKNGKFDRSFEGPKYQVRAQMAKYLDEDVNEQIIIGFGSDGSRKYYNNESKEWMNTPGEATIFSSGDEARDVWFGLDKKPFKRVFVACNDGNV